jgi:O-antigen/teichoic acid export membrane protein
MSQQFVDEIKIAREATITMGGTLTTSVSRYLFNILVARLLGVELLGLYALAISVINLGVTIGKLGLGMGVLRFVAKYRALKQMNEIIATIRKSTTVGIFSSITVAVIILLTSKWISTHLFHAGDTILPDLLRGFALVIPLMIEAQILSAVSQGFKILKYRVIAVDIIPNFFLISAFIVLVFLTKPVWALVLSFGGAHSLSLLAALYFVKRIVPFRSYTIGQAPSNLIRYSLPLMMSSILSMLLFMSDIFMLGALEGSYATGLYQPALRTASVITMLIASFGSIFAPMVSGLHAQNNINKLGELLRLVSRWGLVVTWPLVVFLIIYAPKIMLLFGGDFLAGSSTLRILATTQVFLAITMGSGVIFGMTGYPRLNLINSSVALISNIIANAYLIPRHGIVGAAWGSFIAIVLLFLLRLLESWMIFRLHPFSLKLGKPLLAGLAAAGACYLVNLSIYNWHTLAVLLISMVIFASTYVLVFYLLGVDQEDKEVLNAVRRKLARTITILDRQNKAN